MCPACVCAGSHGGNISCYDGRCNDWELKPVESWFFGFSLFIRFYTAKNIIFVILRHFNCTLDSLVNRKVKGNNI